MKDIKWPLAKQVFVFCGLSFVIVAVFWSIWSLTGAQLPILTYVQPHWAALLEASTPWKIYNPWVLSRWYDLLFFPVWISILVIVIHLTKDKPPLVNLGITAATPIGLAVLTSYPLLFLLGLCSVIALIEGDIINFYISLLSTIFSLKALELILYLYLFFCLPILLFVSPIYFGFIISLLYSATFGFGAGLKVFVFSFVPWYVAYYLIKFIVNSIKKIKKRKNNKNN